MATLDPLDSHVRPPSSRRNLNTEHFAGFSVRSRADLRQAYAFARSLARAPSPEPAPRGHRLVWVRGSAFASSLLASAEDAFAVLGRHTECQLVLPDDPFVALRHVLVRSVALPSGGVALRILDLHTQQGFTLADGSRQTSIFAEGPVAIGLGEYAVVALPPEDPRDPLPEELPVAQIETPAALREQLAALEKAMSPYRANARPPNRTSRITLMPRLVMVGEPLPPNVARLTSGGRYSLTLVRGERQASVALTEEDLQRGVLVGRSEKCHSEDLRRITDINVSRAHVLVLREGPVVYAYDLASTQGTYSAHGAAVRRAVLPDSGAALVLGRGAEAVRLFWRGTP